jgi:6-pyruvoyltetrahydropterin/6-carboxytetrahydropterin synthase
MTPPRRLPSLDWRRIFEPTQAPCAEGGRLTERRAAEGGRRSAIARRARLVASMQVRLVHEFRFEAAHRLPHVPAGHKCARLHGHSFRVELAIEGPVNPKTGWFMDFGDLYRIWEPVHDVLDHRYLNEVPGLENPTSEVLSRWIWEKLRPALPALRRVTLFETCEARCEYEGIED